MTDKLTADQKAIYLKHGGTRCPFCDSPGIEGDAVVVDHGGAFQPCRCLDCEECWEDQYALTGVVAESFSGLPSAEPVHCGNAACIVRGELYGLPGAACPACGGKLHAIKE